MESRLSIVIPALNAADRIGPCLRGTTERDGLVADRIVVDGGSSDETVAVARREAARVVTAPRGRGRQLAAGAAAAGGDWLLFLHADTVLSSGWNAAAAGFMRDPGNRRRAAAFRFALDDPDPAARRLERLVAWRCRAFGLPYGDQGLLIARALYDSVGGFRPLPLYEDVDMVRRIGRRQMTILPVSAVTSAERYRRAGYIRRPARNLFCLGLYFAGVSPRLLARLYG
jgi:rSAM/selenodomain-associated transferase 2